MSGSGVSSDTLSISSQNLQLPPLRSLDDFAFGSARFQLPNFKDFEKWGNRVVKNLLYYQTNYFLLFLTIYGLVMVLNPFKLVCGLLVQALLISILFYLFRTKPGSKINFIVGRAATTGASLQQKWYVAAGAILFGYLVLHFVDAVLLTLFAILFPVSLTFVHSSLRLRNIKNKVVNTMESFGPSTPMGVFLDTLNITADNILS